MISHYLVFNRNCEEALDAYAKAFNGEITEKQKYGDVPDAGFDIDENDKNLIMHARMKFGNTEIMCADNPDNFHAGTNMFISIMTKDAEQIKNAWNILKQDAEIYMELAPTFFAEQHGSLQDKFGVNWMFTVMK